MGEGEGVGWGVRKGSWKREEVKHSENWKGKHVFHEDFNEGGPSVLE